MEFDHHCTFINNCVGRRNFKYFFAILWLTIIWATLAVPAAMVYGCHNVYSRLNEDGFRKRVTITLPLAALGAVLFFVSL